MTPTTSCPRCQTAVESSSKFCQGCGFNVSSDSIPGINTGTGAFQRPPSQLDGLRAATLGEYDIQYELGQGGMATVYLAHEIALDRKVAIKVMASSYLHGPEMVTRFKREARTAGALSHPHIIPIIAVKEAPNLLYIVMKFVPGRSLDSILRETGPLPFSMIRTILCDIGSALDYAHRQGVVHRDVKPGNIMVEEEGFAVITDFGIAKAGENDALTQTGTTVGTPSYLSPEACTGERVGPSADQYSLGVVGYEMLTGQLPFTAESSLSMMYAQVNTPPRPTGTLRPDCPPDLQDAIMRMLEKSPENRFATLKDLVTTLSSRSQGGEDTARSHIGLLAKRRSGPNAPGVRLTPHSPIPTGRQAGANTVRTPGSVDINDSRATPRPQPTAGLRHRIPNWVIGVAAALIAAIAFFLLRPKAAREIPAPVAAAAPDTRRVDSLLIAARGAGAYARQRAVAAGATARALHTGDSVQTMADSLVAQGRKAEAAVLLTSAVSMWADAEQRSGTARTAAANSASKAAAAHAAAPVVVRPPTATVSAAPTAQPVAAAPELSDSQTVAGFYTELRRAIESRQLGEVRRLLPNMNGDEERNWRSMFEDKNIEGIVASYSILKVTRTGEAAYARVSYDLSLTKRGKTDRRARTQLTTLTLGPQGWRQIRAEDVK